MRPVDPVRDAAALWDIATPSPRGRMAGVSMAGFRGRTKNPVDMQVVPYPSLTVAIDFGDGLLIDEASGRRFSGGIVTGLAPGSVRVGGRDIDCLQIRLSPSVAHAVLGAASELSGTVVGLEELWGPDAGRILEQLHAAKSWEERFAIAETTLRRRHGLGRVVDPQVEFAWRQMVSSRGRVRVERLADEIGWSRKRLWSRFRSQVGLTPKRAAQLVRFDHAVHRLAAGHSAALVAAESGYVDQSHLHRDVMAFTGVTPTAVAVAPWLAVDDVAWADPDRIGTRGAAPKR
ncbi:AraC family transcriptional regulator [Nocardia amikacinitolerans]|uniref:AraC family transcriptional regulator n=1 Tax=Nocardia amikacinitolerans TaxID=756689 RepID=UPI00082E8B91|nr:helix-turn-helix domain-containing protein [Nocardia amikacinitolerans]